MLGCAALVQAAEPESPSVVPLDHNTYSITRSAKYIFTRSTKGLKYEVTEEAVSFCASRGKKLKVVSVTEDKPTYLHGGMARVQLIFKALDAGDPELAGGLAPMAAAVIAAGPARIEGGEKAALPDDMQSDLGKLDDLHSRGVLTDKEYTAAKKRLMERIK